MVSVTLSFAVTPCPHRTDTPCGTFQSPGVNVSAGADGVPAEGSELLRATVTAPVGWLVSATVKVAVPRAGPNTDTDVGVTTKEATSVSRLVSDTSAASRPLYAMSELTAGAVTTRYWTSGVTTWSSCPVTVTVCGTFQSAGVNTSAGEDTVPACGSELLSPMVT